MNEQGARQGFALALTGALAAIGDVGVDSALEALRSHSQEITGSAKVRLH